MNILITGASSYIGTYLLKKLSKSKHKVHGIYNSNPVSYENIRLIKYDITDQSHLDNIFNSTKPDVVFHLASVTPTRITNEDDNYITYFNHKVTEQIAKLSTLSNSLLVYTSTDLVYESSDEKINEDSKLRPITIYAKTKLLGENAVRQFAVKHVVLRSSLVYGFTMSTYKSFFDDSFEILKRGEEFTAFTDMLRNPIYVEDVVENLLKVAELYKENITLNFGGEETLSRYDMCVAMAEEFSLDKNLIRKGSCDDFTGHSLVKLLKLDTSMMKNFGMKTDSFTKNLQRAKKYIPTS